MYSFELKGLDKLNERLDKIIANMSTELQEGMNVCMSNTQKGIVREAPKRTGNLKSSIKKEITKKTEKEIVGRVYADVKVAPYALWVNYGTGIYAPLDKSSFSAVLHKKTKSQAKKIPWFVRADEADLSMYRYPTWTAPDGTVYYIVWGARATHFMENGMRGTKRGNIELMRKHIARAMEKEGNNAT